MELLLTRKIGFHKKVEVLQHGLKSGLFVAVTGWVEHMEGLTQQSWKIALQGRTDGEG